MDQEKPKIEVTEDPEYSDLLIDNIMFHGNNIRNPKEWYPELLYNSKLEQGARIYANKNKVAVYPVDGVGMIIEQRFALSEKQKEVYREALTSDRAFKIYVRPDRTVKILFDKGAQEQVRAYNRRAGYIKGVTIDDFYNCIFSRCRRLLRCYCVCLIANDRTFT